MPAGIVLVHGFTGSCKDMLPLYQVLCRSHGPESVINVSLPFHDGDEIPVFNQEEFEQAVKAAAHEFLSEKRDLMLIGHSTGGTLILSCMKKFRFTPKLLILAGTPKKIDVSYLGRWQTHKKGQNEPDFSSIARMISLVNATGRYRFADKFPVLVLNGEDDRLVPREEAFEWADMFSGPVRVVLIPLADHHFRIGEPAAPLFLDSISRAVLDLEHFHRHPSGQLPDRLAEIEPEVIPFISHSPLSVYHLSRSPGGKRVVNETYTFPESVGAEPVFANIEITTHCQLMCRFCARTRLGIKKKHMHLSVFSRILDLLPHAYRITLVGLGEPLLHPDIDEIVKTAVLKKRRVALVTNAINLDRSMSEKLIHAGLESIVFSLDGHDQILTQKLRSGTDVHQVIENIRQFTSLCLDLGKNISKAVFTAVSLISLPSLEKLVSVVAGLGVNVLMVSDLNFESNEQQALWQNMDSTRIKQLHTAIGRTFAGNLPVLGVHGIEEFGLWQRYKDYLAVPAS
ncbi:MAG: alpha/beta fold hydrolase, partial [Desulfobacula sp.]